MYIIYVNHDSVIKQICQLRDKAFLINETHVSGKQPFSAQTTTPFTRAKKIGTARQIFGTVLTILRHGNPNFRRVNVSVPNVMWHQCS